MFANLRRAIAAMHLRYLQSHATEQLIRVFEQREDALARARKELSDLDGRESYLVQHLTQLAIQQIAADKAAPVTRVANA